MGRVASGCHIKPAQVVSEWKQCTTTISTHASCSYFEAEGASAGDLAPAVPAAVCGSPGRNGEAPKRKYFSRRIH